MNELTPCHLPTKATLRKYGLSLDEWLAIYRRQNGCCGICKQPFGDKRANVDHVHIKGWGKMPPEERKHYIRGLLCYFDNKFLVMRGVTEGRLIAAAEYLGRYGGYVTDPSFSIVTPEHEYLLPQSESKSEPPLPPSPAQPD